MNYFGLMFSFFLPGAVLGCMAALAAQGACTSCGKAPAAIIYRGCKG